MVPASELDELEIVAVRLHFSLPEKEHVGQQAAKAAEDDDRQGECRRSILKRRRVGQCQAALR